MKRVAYTSVLFLAIICVAQVCYGQSREAIERTQLGTLQNYYATEDPSYRNIVAQLPEIETTLNELRDQITAAQTARSGQFTTQFSQCLQAISRARSRTESARGQTEVPQYGNIRALVSIPGEDDENRLAKVLQCTAELNALLGRDPAIAQTATRLQSKIGRASCRERVKISWII